MTYTYKLARRLAISWPTLGLLAVFSACTSDTTGPDGTSAATPASLAFRVVPSAVTVETNQPIRFRGERRTRDGQVFPHLLSWEASGGQIHGDGTFSAAAPGTYKVIGKGRGRQKPDTSVVVVLPPQPTLATLVLTPGSVTVQASTSQLFQASGVLDDGSSTAIAVTWHATGGTIDEGGRYTAGTTPGTYRVIAVHGTTSLADTATVTIPAPDLVQVILAPGSASLATGTSRQFAAYGKNSNGDSVAVSATYTATGGSISGSGLFSAGQTAGTYRVIATASGHADTAAVTLTATPTSAPTGSGIPFGPFSAWNGAELKSYTESFTLALDAYSPSVVVSRIDAARANKTKLLLALTGGSHDQYITNGAFDMSKWKAKMDSYNTSAIKTAIAGGVADGTIVGNSVMDEPNHHTWGGVMTKAKVDQMCAYVKNFFPTLPVGVVHRHDQFDPSANYSVCQFIVDQYSSKLGSVSAFRDAGLAYAQRDGIAIAFSLNILDGGIQAARDGQWNCPLTTTDGRGTYEPNCRMTAQQVRDFSSVLGPAGCALMMWRYDDIYMAKSTNQQAFKDVAAKLAPLPAKPCAR